MHPNHKSTAYPPTSHIAHIFNEIAYYASAYIVICIIAGTLVVSVLEFLNSISPYSPYDGLLLNAACAVIAFTHVVLRFVFSIALLWIVRCFLDVLFFAWMVLWGWRAHREEGRWVWR
jgi:hypothetical protein